MMDPEQNSPKQGSDATAADTGKPAGSESAKKTSSAEEIKQLEEKAADFQDRLLRTQADLENFRRRVYRDQEEARKYESFRIVRDILPALDGLQRAVASAEQTGDLQNLLEGIRMVSQQFKDILKSHSAEPIEAIGKPFDPNEHEALTQIPSADCEPMTVLQVVEMGYRLHDRVVRPTRVIVSSAMPNAPG